jgi:DNA-binding response OmpR family regulator
VVFSSQSVSRLVQFLLRIQNTQAAYNGEEGLFMVENEPSDLIILDIMLPFIDGTTILKRIRKAGIKTPVLMLTANDTIMDKVLGLDSGTDDYLTKPFAFEEVLACVRASHELRTPLSIIMSQSKIALRKERNLEEYKNTLTPSQKPQG